MTTPPPPPPVGYPQRGGHPGAYYAYPPAGPTNSLAIASLVCSLLVAPLGIVFGHMSLAQIKRTGEQGRGLAIAGLVIGYLVSVGTVIAVLVTVLILVAVAGRLEQIDYADDHPRADPAPAVEQPLPPFTPPATLGSNCQYPATTEPGAKPAHPPQVGRAATTPASIPAGIVTDRGDIGLQLDNAKAPCTVRNFTSLARQGFFDDTRCHRLTVGPEMHVLQCGDPTGSGAGGPGYRFPNEYPSNQYRLTDPAMTTPVVYPRGTLAMANSGPGTNGSQFFLVYDDSALPPTYTAFGTIDAKGLAALDNVAAAGVAGGTQDGMPMTVVTIESVRIG